MADPTLSAIDRFFDFVDKSVDAADRVLNRGKHLEDKQTERRARREVREVREAREVIDATSTEKTPERTAEKSVKKTPASTSTAIARRAHFYIVEAIDPKSGATIYVVTDGRNARTECSTREFATKILRALEKTP